MARKRYTVEQIIAKLREAAAQLSSADTTSTAAVLAKHTPRLRERIAKAKGARCPV